MKNKIKDIFEAFGSETVGQLIYLYTLLFVWTELLFPLIENQFEKLFLSIILFTFIISKAILILWKVYEK